MINLIYDRVKNQTFVSIDAFVHDYDIFPFKIKFRNIVNYEINYETELYPNMWTI